VPTQSPGRINATISMLRLPRQSGKKWAALCREPR
jgi:hypothetical protein